MIIDSRVATTIETIGAPTATTPSGTPTAVSGGEMSREIAGSIV
jgi:hypothetical protein